jgi:hypothetical protein
MKDQKLQELIESGSSQGDRDSRLYQVVFKALHTESDFVLPAHFADRVLAAVKARHSSHDMAWFIGGIFLFIIALVVAVILTGFSFSLGVFTFLSGYPGLVIFGAAFIMALQWIDRRWIRKPAL